MRPDVGSDHDLAGRVRSRLLDDHDPAFDPRAPAPTRARVAAAVRAEAGLLDPPTVLAAAHSLHEELVGLGPLAALLADPTVTDVLVNAADEVWVDRGDGLSRAPIVLTGDDPVRRLAVRLAARAGRRLDDAAPWCDVTLPDGVRVHAVLAPVSARGTVLSVRVPARRPWTLEGLQRSGAFGAVGSRVLRSLVESRVSFLVSGGTGTGKTTVLATLLGLVPHDQRLVLVEDLAELAPHHPHAVTLVARPANVEGAGEIRLRDLVRQALRMRPDRLVVGECRGAEVVDLLAALNTGHEGGCGTVHANSASDVPARLEALGQVAGLSRAAVHAQVAGALSAVVHLRRDADGRRRLEEVAAFVRAADGSVSTEPAWVRGESDLVPAVAARLLAAKGVDA